MRARRLRGHLSYANVMATIAVFAAIGGGAYAAGLAKNSVASKQIKPGAVKSSDVKNDSLTGRDIREDKLTLPQGPQGPRGPQGPAGSDGSPDTGAQILGKLAGVDGSGSGLDADTLDGIDSGAVGQTASGDKTLSRPANNGSFSFAPMLDIPGGNFQAQCLNNGGTTQPKVLYRNMTDGQQQVWTSGAPTLAALGPGNGIFIDTPVGDLAREANLLISNPDGSTVSVFMGEAATTNGADGCSFAVQTMSSP